MRLTDSTPPARSSSSARSSRARNASRSSGRGRSRLARRPNMMSSRVPGFTPSLMSAPTSALIVATSPLLTPARDKARASVSLLPTWALSSICGRSGVWRSGCTASVAPIRRPLSAPSASGVIIWLRTSSYCASAIVRPGSPGMGLKPGDRYSAVAHSPKQVARPRNQVGLPIRWARSGTSSTSSAHSRSRIRHSRGGTGAGWRNESASHSDMVAPPCCDPNWLS